MQAYKTLSLIVSIYFLQGCATPEESMNKMRAKSDYILCTEYMTLPTANIEHRYREQEISRRNINCNQYGDSAAERRKADAAFQEGLRNLQGQNKAQGQPQSQQRPYNPNACIQDGGPIYCPNYPRR